MIVVYNLKSRLKKCYLGFRNDKSWAGPSDNSQQKVVSRTDKSLGENCNSRILLGLFLFLGGKEREKRLV